MSSLGAIMLDIVPYCIRAASVWDPPEVGAPAHAGAAVRRRNSRWQALFVASPGRPNTFQQKICVSLLFSLCCLAEVGEGDSMRLILCLLCLGGCAAVAQHRSPRGTVEPDARLWQPWLLTSPSEI